ncbi:MAG: hypothetical protein ACK5MQ_12720 [Pikeienuella sp.]
MRLIFCMIFSALALLALALDLWRSQAQGRAELFSSTADCWRAIDPASLSAAEAFVRENISAATWEGIAAPALSAPVFATALALALFFYLIRKRRPRARKGLMFPRKRRR